MSISEELTKLDDYATQIETILPEIKSALEVFEIDMPEKFKLTNVPELIATIKTGVELLIEITAQEYEEATFTATHEDGETIATTTITQGVGTIEVPKGGTYTITNDVDEESQEVTLVDNVSAEFVKTG